MMDKEVEENYSEDPSRSSFVPLDFVVHQQDDPENGTEMVDYMQLQRQISLADVMQFADFGPKFALNQSKMPSEDKNYFFMFHEGLSSGAAIPPTDMFAGEGRGEEEDGGMFSENNSSVQQLGFGSGGGKIGGVEPKNRRKRPRTMKTTEEVESQRMTHIAVERNRRRQMNEHLRMLRSLMPGSYVQRGDQASIIGGAIEFVRELEQLLQCLQSQKRRRLFGSSEPSRNTADVPALPILQSQQSFFPPLTLPTGSSDGMRLADVDPSSAVTEEMAENKSCLADIEVRLLGFDAMIKILSRRRAGQLIKIITSLEDLQFTILHTNITTIEQTVLYSFNGKIASETRCTAEDIANSVQQILSFIDTNSI